MARPPFLLRPLLRLLSREFPESPDFCKPWTQPETNRIGAEEQIAEGAAQKIGDPPLCQVVRPIMDHVAALAQALEVAQPVIAGS
jgi:hypothetical protein